MKRAPRNRHDTSSRPTGWILHVMYRLWKHLISSSYLPWEECTALFAWKPRRRRRRKSSSSLCSLPPPSWGPSISSRSSSQCIHHVRPHPHWYVCLHTAITRLIGSSQRKLAASKMQEMTPSSSFPTISFFFFTKFINTDITILLATLINFLFQRGAISEWFKRPTTVSVSSDCSRRLIYGRCSIQ